MTSNQRSLVLFLDFWTRLGNFRNVAGKFVYSGCTATSSRCRADHVLPFSMSQIKQHIHELYNHQNSGKLCNGHYNVHCLVPIDPQLITMYPLSDRSFNLENCHLHQQAKSAIHQPNVSNTLPTQSIHLHMKKFICTDLSCSSASYAIHANIKQL